MYSPKPPYTEPNQTTSSLIKNGFSLLAPIDFLSITQSTDSQWQELGQNWNTLPPDDYLKDGGRYRKRKHASLIIQNENSIEIAPPRPHWQPISYNALHGGIDRWFKHCDQDFLKAIPFQNLLQELSKLFYIAKNIQPYASPWFVEVHQFRIDTKDGIGRPTPEGAHRDGVDFVAVLLMNRQFIKGGESRVFAIDGPNGLRFTLNESLSLLLLDDEKVIHETTPIQPESPEVKDQAWRDTLVLTFRLNNFQDKLN